MWRLGRPLLFVILLAGCAVTAASQSDSIQPFQQTQALPPSGKIFVRNIYGNVRVTAWDRAEVKVEAVKRAKAGANLGTAEIVVVNQAGGLCVASKYDRSRSLKEWFGLEADPCRDSQTIHTEPGDLATVDYTIWVPRQAQLTIVNVNGDVDVSGTANDLVVDIANGHLTARDVSGYCRLFGSFSGVNVTLTSLARDTRIESAVGPLIVYVAPEISARLRARAGRGRIRNDFGWEQRPREELQASLGSAQMSLDIQSYDGEVEIRRLQPIVPPKSSPRPPKSRQVQHSKAQ